MSNWPRKKSNRALPGRSTEGVLIAGARSRPAAASARGCQRTCSWSPFRGSGAPTKHLASLVYGASSAPRAAMSSPDSSTLLGRGATLAKAERLAACIRQNRFAPAGYSHHTVAANSMRSPRADPSGGRRSAGFRSPRRGAARSSHAVPVATRTLGEERFWEDTGGFRRGDRFLFNAVAARFLFPWWEGVEGGGRVDFGYAPTWRPQSGCSTNREPHGSDSASHKGPSLGRSQ